MTERWNGGDLWNCPRSTLELAARLAFGPDARVGRLTSGLYAHVRTDDGRTVVFGEESVRHVLRGVLGGGPMNLGRHPVHVFPSEGEPGRVHLVVIRRAGTLCSCSGFQFRGTCPHVETVKGRTRALERRGQ